MHADPHAHGTVAEGILGVSGGSDGVGRTRERDEERVPLRVHLDPAVPRKGLAQHAAVLREHVRIALPQFVQETGRTLDVREQQRDSPARKLRHVHMIVAR